MDKHTRASLIQNTDRPDSIIARSQCSKEFCNPKRTFGPVPYLHSNAIPEYYLDIKVSEKKQWICQSPNMPNRVRFTLLIRSSDQVHSIWCLCPAGRRISICGGTIRSRPIGSRGSPDFRGLSCSTNAGQACRIAVLARPAWNRELMTSVRSWMRRDRSAPRCWEFLKVVLWRLYSRQRTLIDAKHSCCTARLPNLDRGFQPRAISMPSLHT